MRFLILFLKKTYKIFIVILAVLIFFLGYNTYLIDHSLVNLRIALDKVSDVKTLNEVRKLEPFLKNPILKELSQRKLDAKSFLELEFSKDILTEPKDMDQLEEVKMFISEVIQKMIEKRGRLLSFLDRMSSILDPRYREPPILNKKRKVKFLLEKIPLLKSTAELQEAYFDLASTYISLEDFAKAKETFSKLIELDKNSPLALRAKFNLAWIDKIEKRFDESIAKFEGLSKEYPEAEIAIVSKYQMANVYQKKGEFEKVISIYESIFKEHPESEISTLAEFQGGYIYLYDLKNHQKALEIFGKIKEERPQDILTKHIESKMEVSIGRYYREWGYRLLFQGNYNEAIEYFSLALKTNLKDGASMVGKGLAYFWLGEEDLALEMGRNGKKVSPNDEITLINLGVLYIYLGMLDEAISEYKKVISINPKSSKAHYNLGYIYAIKGDFDKAAKEFRDTISLDSKFAFAYNNLGWVLWQIKRYNEAVVEFQRAIKVKPDYLEAHFNLGIVLKIQGRYEEAKKEFEEVLKIKPDYSEAIMNIKELDKLLAVK